MTYGVSERLRRRVSLVILPVDGFTGKALAGADIHIQVEGAHRPLVKPDGFYVFCELPGEEVFAVLWGRHYRRMRVRIRFAELDPVNPVKVIRLNPDKDYPFPKGTAFLEGLLPEHSVLYAAGKAKACAGKLRADCEKGADTVAVYQEEETDLTGAAFLLSDKDRTVNDWAELLSPEDPARGIYRMQEAAARTYRRMETDLFPAVRYEADETETSYFAAVRTDAGGDAVCVECCVTRGGEKKEYTFFVKAGEHLRQDF